MLLRHISFFEDTYVHILTKSTIKCYVFFQAPRLDDQVLSFEFYFSNFSHPFFFVPTATTLNHIQLIRKEHSRKWLRICLRFKVEFQSHFLVEPIQETNNGCFNQNKFYILPFSSIIISFYLSNAMLFPVEQGCSHHSDRACLSFINHLYH